MLGQRILHGAGDVQQQGVADGVAATRASTAEEFHAQLEAALQQQGPRLIEARVTDSIAPFVAMIRGAR